MRAWRAPEKPAPATAIYRFPEEIINSRISGPVLHSVQRRYAPPSDRSPRPVVCAFRQAGRDPFRKARVLSQISGGPIDHFMKKQGAPVGQIEGRS